MRARSGDGRRSRRIGPGAGLGKGLAAMQGLSSPSLVCPCDSCWQHAEPEPSRAGSGSEHSLPASGKDRGTQRRLQMDRPGHPSLGWARPQPLPQRPWILGKVSSLEQCSDTGAAPQGSGGVTTPGGAHKRGRGGTGTWFGGTS